MEYPKFEPPAEGFSLLNRGHLLTVVRIQTPKEETAQKSVRIEEEPQVACGEADPRCTGTEDHIHTACPEMKRAIREQADELVKRHLEEYQRAQEEDLYPYTQKSDDLTTLRGQGTGALEGYHTLCGKASGTYLPRLKRTGHPRR